MKKFLSIIFLFTIFHSSFAEENTFLKLSKDISKNKKQVIYYPFGVGFGIGNPLVNLILSFPYIDFEIGYGGFVGFGPDSFLSFLTASIDNIYRKKITEDVIIGGGLGLIADWSLPLVNTSTYNRIGIGLRTPIVIEYQFFSKIVVGFKAAPTIFAVIGISGPKLFEGIRFGFYGSGFIKYYI